MNLGFKSLHPVTALIFFIFSFIISLTLTDPIPLFLCFTCGVVYDLKLQRKKAVSFLLKFILPLIALITAFNGLFSHYGVTVLFVMKNGNNFTLEALAYGFVSAVKISSMLMWLDCFNEVVESDKIIFLFGRFSPRLALIISMVLRFIPLIRTQSEEISKAEKGVGNGTDAVGFLAKIKLASRRLSILVSWTLEKGIDTANSMRSRGYGLHGRTSYNSYVFSLRDLVIVLITVSAVIFTFVFGELFIASYNPIIEISNLTISKIVISLFFTFVLLMPIILDVMEEKRWSISD